MKKRLDFSKKRLSTAAAVVASRDDDALDEQDEKRSDFERATLPGMTSMMQAKAPLTLPRIPSPAPVAVQQQLHPIVSIPPVVVTQQRVPPKNMFLRNDNASASRGQLDLIIRQATNSPNNQPGSLSGKTSAIRRHFRASFGPNGQLVIPNRDGTVTIDFKSTLPKHKNSNDLEAALLDIHFVTASNPKRDAEQRIQAYAQASKSSSRPQEEIVWNLIDAAWGAKHPVPEQPVAVDGFGERASKRHVHLQQIRGDSIDSWLRQTLEEPAIRGRSREKSGLFVGNGEEERTMLAETKSIDALRAATLAAQGPGIGSDVFQLVAQKTTGKNEKLEQVRSLLTLTEDTRKWRQQQYPMKEWIRSFALEFWSRPVVLDPLHKVLEDFQQNHPTPSDGVFRLLQLACARQERDGSARLTKALMALKNDVRDWSLAWHVGRIFLDAWGKDFISERQTALLAVSFATQLEQQGMWEWAVYVLFKTLPARDVSRGMQAVDVPDLYEVRRKGAIYGVLTRHLLNADEKASDFLVRKLAILPKQYIHWSEAVGAGYNKTYLPGGYDPWRHKQTRLLLESEQLYEWAQVFFALDGPMMVLERRFGEFEAILTARAYFEARGPPMELHLQSAYRWSVLVMEYMRLLQMEASVLEDVRRLADEVARWRQWHAFPVESVARLVVEDMSKWVAKRMSELFDANKASEEDLQLVWATGLSAEERRLFIARHVAGMMAT